MTESTESAASLIERLQMQPHPEGGYYRETYRSSCEIQLPGLFPGPRSASTGIYYLLERGDFSAFHRIKSDEMWHFYAGDPIVVHVLHANRAERYQRIELGRGLAYQAVVPAGAWFASESAGEFSLVGCTVAPGFDFADFEMAERSRLIKDFPEYADLIGRLTR